MAVVGLGDGLSFSPRSVVDTFNGLGGVGRDCLKLVAKNASVLLPLDGDLFEGLLLLKLEPPTPTDPWSSGMDGLGKGLGINPPRESSHSHGWR
jgi:hypothetical protein